MKNPKSGQVYSFKEIAEELILKDSPFLLLEIPGTPSHQVIQTTHVTDDQMLAIPGMAESQWRFIRTTSEWIPIFWAADNAKALELVSYEQDLSRYSKPRNMWVTPKGHPCDQYAYAD